VVRVARRRRWAYGKAREPDAPEAYPEGTLRTQAGERNAARGPTPAGHISYSFRLRNLSALVITETEENDIAAAAIIGDKSRPNTG